MQIVFINPPIWDTTGIHFRLNQATGAPLLVAQLRKAGHKAYYLDAEACHWSFEQLTSWLKQYHPDGIGVTVTSLNYQGVNRLARCIQYELPDIYFAVGGPHATAMPDQTLKDLKCDAVCIGEGDLVVTGMFEQQRKGLIQGIMPLKLDELPFPAFEYSIPTLDKYNGNQPLFEAPEGIMLVARGCPNKCSFCSNPVYQLKKMRYHSPQYIVEELKYLKSRFQIQHIFHYSDEMISGYKTNQWLIPVCDEIAQANLNMTFKTQGRCSKHITKEALIAMKKAGCKAIMWGVESLSQTVLDAMDKGTQVDEIWRVLRLSHEVGIRNWGFFMVGCVAETYNEFAKTYYGVQQMKKEGLLDYKQVTIMTPEPGSKLYQVAVDNNWFVKTAQVHHYDATMNLPWATTDEINKRREMLAAL